MPLLSICIPTFNRADYLDRTLASIVGQRIFRETDEIEIVISDNASTDTTCDIVKNYLDIFKGKITYFCNATNMYDNNFELALSHGKGTFLKLHNDTLYMNPGSLEKILSLIKKNIREKAILFFSNTPQKNIPDISICHNVDEFILTASYYCTWIGGFGIWKEHFDSLENFSRFSHLQLAQVDVLLRMITKIKISYVVSEILFCSVPPMTKGGYNIAKIFGENYLFLLKHHNISKKTFEIEKKKLLSYLIDFYFDFNNNFNFLKTGFFKYLKAYHFNFYFYLSYYSILRKTIKYKIRKRKRPPLSLLQKKWRSFNFHNEINILNCCDINKIIVGRYSQGNIFVYTSNNINEKLIIGNFVTIEKGVHFIFRKKTSNSYLINYSLSTFEAPTNHNIEDCITIKDDVSIGHNSIILSGVTIGQGAIISPGSVVTSNVAPYAIVEGNPAQLIKYRFSNPVCNKLKSFSFAVLSPDIIQSHKDFLLVELTEERLITLWDRLQ